METVLTEQSSQEKPAINYGHITSKAALIVVYLIFVYAHLQALTTGGFRLSLVLFLAFESVIITMVFLRREAASIQRSPVAVVAALAGTFFVLGFRPVGQTEDLLLGQAIQILGVVLQVGAALSLGRSFGLVAADRGIKTGGLYRIVRHPIYFAYIVAQTGYIISNLSGWNVALFSIGTGFQVMRINYEESLLSDNAEYQRYLQTVRWHLVPGIW